ncbi:hypothetical protein K6025_05230 [Ehrlichia sp. JZT12]
MFNNITIPMMTLVNAFKGCINVIPSSLMIAMNNSAVTTKTCINHGIKNVCISGTSATNEPLKILFALGRYFSSIVQNECFASSSDATDYEYDRASFTHGFLWGLITAGWLFVSYCVLKDYMKQSIIKVTKYQHFSAEVRTQLPSSTIKDPKEEEVTYNYRRFV